MASSSRRSPLSIDAFRQRVLDREKIQSFEELCQLRNEAVTTENLYRELFAQSRDSWEVPEIDDPYLFLLNVFGDQDELKSCESHNEKKDDSFVTLAGTPTATATAINAATLDQPSPWKRLPRFPDDALPRCFDLEKKREDNADTNEGENNQEEQQEESPKQQASRTEQQQQVSRLIPEGALVTVPTLRDFQLSWDCLTEGLLRFVDWRNVFAAGGAVSGCLAPLPPNVTEGGISATRVKRRKYFHDEFLPGSDIDLFLYGLDETAAKAKLIELYDAIQAANPFPIRAIRSSHAITLVSRYPFRHVQIVLRLYNSPAEILMGFDVDSCAVGYDGRHVVCCPRTLLALETQSNVVDVATRRSPSYEMRLAKYAQRGFQVVVPTLLRDRVDPFLYEKRFDQTKGLARLLLLERLQTPEARLRHRLESQLKSTGHSNPRSAHHLEWMIQSKIRQSAGDVRNLDRMEGHTDGMPALARTGPEMSDYSTVFLPWGPNWTAERIEKLIKKKDRILNRIEFLTDGRVVANRKPYKVHVCAVGTMEEILVNPFPDDPPIPADTPPEALEGTVRGPLSWLVDNPGRQHIGSFHPITDDDWADGAYISKATEALILAAIANDVDTMKELLQEGSKRVETTEDAEAEATTATTTRAAAPLLLTRDFLGRTVLHVAALAHSVEAAQTVLQHYKGPEDNFEFLKCRLADGRTALQLAAIRGDVEIAQLILDKRRELAAQKVATIVAAKGDDNDDEDEDDEEDEICTDIEAIAVEILDIDGADWEVKMNAIQYAVAFGHVNMVRLLLSHGASVRKIAVHKDRGESMSILSLFAFYASECGDAGREVLKPMAQLLMDAGASTAQVDMAGTTCWHRFAMCTRKSSEAALGILLELDAAKNCTAGGKGVARALDVLDLQMRTPVFVATICANVPAIRLLLQAGAAPHFTQQNWDLRVRQVTEARKDKGGNTSRTYYPHMAPNDLERLRCPISAAAENAHGPCLKAFIDHDSTLANSVVQVTGGGEDCGYGLFTHQGQKPAKLVLKRPLDILTQLRDSVLGTNNSVVDSKIPEANLARIHDQIKVAKSRVRKAQERRDDHTKDSYQYFAWALAAVREEHLVENLETQSKFYEMTKEDTQNEEEAVTQIDEAMDVVRKAGGVPHPRDAEGAATIVPLDHRPSRMPHFSTMRVHPHGVLGLEDNIPPPFKSFLEMEPLDFQTANRMVYGNVYRNKHMRLLQLENEHALKLLVAATKGDAGKIKEASVLSRVCIFDEVGTSPLFLATLHGNVDCLRIIFEEAQRQFRAHVVKQLAHKKEKANAENDGESSNNLKDKLRRLNNLEIAEGEVPRDAGPTPDRMRLQLEAAEAAAMNQSAADDELPPTVSSVAPEVLLLHRSIILPSEEPKLSELMKRLQEKQPHSFSEEWLKSPVRVRPLELAVVRGDLAMVKTLIELALKGEASAVNEKKDSRDPQSDVGVELDKAAEFDGNVDQCDEAEEFLDEENDQVERHEESNQGDSQNNIVSLTVVELRNLLAGVGSMNLDLGGMTLPQLAVAMDNLDVFNAIARYAREQVLPRGAVLSWKQEIEGKDSGTVDKRIKARRDKEKNLISGNSAGYYHHQRYVPLWAADDNHHNQHLFVTPLQFALGVGSEKVTRALLSTDADSALLGWILDEAKGVTKQKDTLKIDKRKCPQERALLEEPVATAKWIIRQISGSEQVALRTLAYRLVRPTAKDSAGRTALFYSPAEWIEQVVASAVDAASAAGAESSPLSSAVKSQFLEMTSTSESVTPLMAAASARQADRVKALLSVGCQISTRSGPNNWNAVHLAIPNQGVRGTISAKRSTIFARRSMPALGNQIGELPNLSQIWGETRTIIDLLLNDAPASEVEECLLSPHAEHTPLMLAADRGADGEMMSFFIQKLGEAAARNCLASRDGELNSALHLAVVATLSASTEGGVVVTKGRSQQLEAVDVMLQQPHLPTILGPKVENARGVTPEELVLQSVASIWVRSSLQNRAHAHKQHRPMMQSRQVNGKGPLPPKLQGTSSTSQTGEGEVVSEEEMGRYTLSVLRRLTDARSLLAFRRVPVSFDESASSSKKRLHQQKQVEVAVQGQPTGPPMILVQTEVRYFHGGTQQWNGWPVN